VLARRAPICVLAALVVPAVPAAVDGDMAVCAVTGADAVAAVLPLVVTIEGDGVFGAGILVDPAAGLVVTSHHVVEEMKAPRVATHGGKKGTARVARIDRERDLALLEVPALVDAELPRPRFVAPSALRPGQEVYAIGSPRKLPFSVSRGIVSFLDRAVGGGKFIQLDMSINEGNSGGPVFTLDGEIVGVMSFVMRRATGIAFATPATRVFTAFPSLREETPSGPRRRGDDAGSRARR
jgi:S1-C subfamily serine protease